nr:hypothetical protein CFP56_62539 [Quercus suber]
MPLWPPYRMGTSDDLPKQTEHLKGEFASFNLVAPRRRRDVMCIMCVLDLDDGNVGTSTHKFTARHGLLCGRWASDDHAEVAMEYAVYCDCNSERPFRIPKTLINHYWLVPKGFRFRFCPLARESSPSSIGSPFYTTASTTVHGITGHVRIGSSSCPSLKLWGKSRKWVERE